MDKKNIIEKLKFLIKNDKNQQTLYGYKTYGASRHKFVLNPTIEIESVIEFEKKNNISFPKDYTFFITEIGNGGAGPGNGLHPLNKWNYDLDDVNEAFLMTEFPHENTWNEKYLYAGEDNTKLEYSHFEKDYYDNDKVTGAIRISDYGCGINYMLVVSGKQKGTVWVDDRCSENGIYNLKTTEKYPLWTFENWYLNWLDKSIEDLLHNS